MDGKRTKLIDRDLSFTSLLAASVYEPAVNEVTVPVLGREICNAWLVHKELNVTDGMICAGYPEGGKDACQVCAFNCDIFQFQWLVLFWQSIIFS